MAHAKHSHASKSPASLPLEHHCASPTTYHVEVEELMAVHGTMIVVRVDPKEHLASATAVAVSLCQVRAWEIEPDELHICSSQFVVFFSSGN